MSSDAKWPLMLIAATIHAPRKTTEVLNAVTSVESWPWIPSFASTAVMPAKNAEPKANRSHIFSGYRYSVRPSLLRWMHGVLLLKTAVVLLGSAIG